MRRFTSFAAVLIMFFMVLPTLACAATPNMTRMEQDCCQQMRGKCGEMAKQGCCKMEVRDDLFQLPAHVTATPVLSLTWTPIFYPLLADMSTSAGYRWHIPTQHSPPGLIIATTTVLRI